MSSKAALSILVKAVSSCALVPLVLHMDATYKLNSNEYPVLILGLSDAQQQFHLLSISVLSHHTKAVYREVLRVFKRVIMHVVPDISFSPQYVVTDCDAAERYSEMWYISIYVYVVEFCNWFHNYFSSSICFRPRRRTVSSAISKRKPCSAILCTWPRLTRDGTRTRLRRQWRCAIGICQRERRFAMLS